MLRYFVFGVGMTTFSRFLFATFFRLRLGKPVKVRKYKREYSFLDRWFFLSLHKEIKDKYNKAEQRRIKYSSIAKIYYCANMINHVALIIYILFLMIVMFVQASQKVLDGCMYALLILHFVFIVLISIMTLYEYANYFKKRERRTWGRFF